jgi:NAD(P)-dependent dehydrogenase (short-subunit alcohol dehydrogenase family)
MGAQQAAPQGDGADGPLVGQVALVTGAGRGIGRAMAEALAAAGAKVGLLARTAAQVRETEARVAAGGGVALAVTADVRNPDQVAEAVGEVAAQLGPVDLLVNNAGTNAAIGPIWEVDPEEWWSVVAINLRGPFLCARAVLPAMIEHGRGRVVNVASHASVRAGPYNTAYASSKTALVRFTDCLAEEVRPHGIAVFALSPGSVQTALTDGVRSSPAGRRWRFGELAALQWVPPDLAADAVVFLATGAADGLTGRFFHVSNDVRRLAGEAERVVAGDYYQLRWRTPDA